MTQPTHDLTATLLAVAARQPDAPFLREDGGNALRWSAFATHVRELRDRFAGWDIVRGDVVVAAAGRRARDFVLVAAAPAASSFLLLSPSLTEEQYARMLSRSRARAVIVPDDPAHALARAARASGAILLRLADPGSGAPGAFRLESIGAVAPRRHAPRASAGVALVTATSGTTGQPKLVPLLHRSLVAQALDMGARLAMSPADIAWHGVPLHLAFGKRSGFLLCVANGGSVHCLPESDVDALAAIVKTDPPGYLPVTFAVARALLERLQPPAAGAPRRLRFALVGSGAFGAAERERLEVALGAPVLRHYGATEAGTVSIQDLPPAPRDPEGSGRPVDAIVTLVDASGAEVPPGAVGEILVRGPQVFDGYLDDPDASAGALVDGAYRTGDLARIGAGGELCILDRLKDMINRGGEQIAPAEIDEALRALPGVADAAAFGIGHAMLGEEVVAAVVPAPGGVADPEAMLARVRVVLGPRRTPKQLWLVDALPRNRAGKVVRSELAALVGVGAIEPGRNAANPSSPSSPHAAALGALWASVLGVAQVVESDSFRALGGDDAKAAMLLAVAGAVFDIALPADALDAEGTTLASMARDIDERLRARDAAKSGQALTPDRAGL